MYYVDYGISGRTKNKGISSSSFKLTRWALGPSRGDSVTLAIFSDKKSLNIGDVLLQIGKKQVIEPHKFNMSTTGRKVRGFTAEITIRIAGRCIFG